jgi:hypothetical protein
VERLGDDLLLQGTPLRATSGASARAGVDLPGPGH